MTDESAPPEGQRDRRTYVLGCDLDPGSLCGSWVLGFEEADGRFNRFEEEVRFVGLVVGEPQPGVYLVEVFDHMDSESVMRGGKYQRPMKLDEFIDREDGLRYRFYDTDVRLRQALKAYTIDTTTRTREAS